MSLLSMVGRVPTFNELLVSHLLAVNRLLSNEPSIQSTTALHLENVHQSTHLRVVARTARETSESETAWAGSSKSISSSFKAPEES